jgi:hypothetical protein
MNFGDSVQDASRSGPGDTTVAGAVGGNGDSHQARSPRTQKPLQDIQDLRNPDRRSDSAPEPVGLGREAPQ